MAQPPGPLSRTILIVDHAVARLARLRREFELCGYRTLSAVSAEAALRLVDAASWPIGFVLCAITLPDMNGGILHAELRRTGRGFPFVLMADPGQAPPPPNGADAPLVLERPFTVAQAETAFRKAGSAVFRGV